MDNNLKKIEKDLRAFAKRCKDIKYTQILLFVFLLTGLLSLAAPADSVETARRDLNTSITDMKKLFKEAKQENNKLMKGSNLELIQLMEQGDHVVKSPWSSWQYGMNYFYGDWTGTYKGRGDKKEKYPYEGILTRDENEFNRYVATNSSMYSSLATSTNPRSASTNLRKGLSNYGLASNTTQQEPIVSLEVNAGITPRVINKKSPDTSPAAPDVTLPTFEPKLITPPVPPQKPDEPTINLPSLNVVVKSAGNGSQAVVLGNGTNSLIQEVAITDGTFKIERNSTRAALANSNQSGIPAGTPPMWSYTYTDYKGMNAFHTNATSNGFDASNNGIAGQTATAPGGTWGPLNQTTPASNESNITWQRNLGFLSVNAGAMLNNATSFLYTNPINSSYLLELVHQDVHGGYLTASIRKGIVDSVGATSAITTAYDDMVAYNTTATQKANGGVPGPITKQHTFLNGGKIVIEGSNTSLGNTYSHSGGHEVRQSTVNAGEIIFQPYSDGTTQFDKNSAMFVISTDISANQEQDSINYNSGKIKMYTMNAVGLVSDAKGLRPVSVINRGDFQLYGESSAGIYMKRKANLDLQTVTKDFAFNAATNEVTAGSFKPIEIFGDKSIGLYQFAEGGTAEGNFAVNIGALGKGNENFSTAAVSNLTAGTNITDLNINPTNGTNTNIQGSFGILSNNKIDLTSHQIKIFDKTEGNVGVYPNKNVALNIGGGSIELNGGTGTTSKNNIGVYINGQGSVKSTGDIKVDGGAGNLAIYAVGGSIPGSSITNHVEVKEVKATDTKNSVLIYGSTGAKVKLSDGTGLPTGATYGLNISNATV